MSIQELHLPSKHREQPILNPTWMAEFSRGIYQKAEQQDPQGRSIGAASKLCFDVNSIAAEALHNQGVEGAEYLGYDRRESKGHALIRVKGKPNYAIDLQYQQFIAPEQRVGLPDFIVFPYQTEEDVKRELTKRGVTEKHGYWLERLFWDENGYSRR